MLVDGAVVGDFHADGHVVPGLHHRRVHRRGRVAHDHVPGPGHRRRRQHRLRRCRRGGAGQLTPRSATRASSRWWWAPATSSTTRPARPGPSPGSAGISGQQQRLHRRQPSDAPGFTGRLPPGDRLVQPVRRRLGRRLLRDHLRRRPARQLPGVAPGLQGAGRRRRRGDLHALGHVVPGLHHRRVHRRGRVAHDHVPGPGQRRRRQHRLRRSRRGRAGQHTHDRRPGLRAGGGGSRQLPVRPDRLALDLLRQLPASRPTTAASLPATRRRPRVHRSPSSRRPARSARPSPAGRPAPT